MPEEIGFAIVGLRRGYQAAKEAVAAPGAKLVAVADLDTARAQEVAKELGCEWTADYQELVRRDDVQVVGAWTPSGAHAMVCRDALRAGKHAVTTKPMEVTVAKCDAMIEDARKRNLLLAIDFGNRYRPEVRQVKRAVDQGEFGMPPEREVVIPPEENPPANWCEDVVSALTKGTKVACDGVEGRRSVLVNMAIYESARIGKPVKIEE